MARPTGGSPRTRSAGSARAAGTALAAYTPFDFPPARRRKGQHHAPAPNPAPNPHPHVRRRLHEPDLTARGDVGSDILALLVGPVDLFDRDAERRTGEPAGSTTGRRRLREQLRDSRILRFAWRPLGAWLNCELRAHFGSTPSRLPRAAGRSPPVTRDATASAAARNFASGRASGAGGRGSRGQNQDRAHRVRVRPDRLRPSEAVGE